MFELNRGDNLDTITTWNSTYAYAKRRQCCSSRKRVLE
jgi:hypothetical protein